MNNNAHTNTVNQANSQAVQNEVHWQRIISLLPKIEAAARRRYPHSVPEFMDAGIDALLALPLPEIDPDSPQAHTDSYLVQRAVFAGQRLLWPEFARGVWEFTDLAGPDGEWEWWLQAALSQGTTGDEAWPVPNTDPADNLTDDSGELAEAMERLVQQLPPQERQLFYLIQEAVTAGDEALFFQSGQVKQIGLAQQSGISRSRLNRTFNSLRQAFAPLAQGTAAAYAHS
jgi:hypothetical protein